MCRENRTELQSVDELVEEGNPSHADVATGVENADNDEKKRTPHLRYSTRMLPNQYFAEEK
jgi:hypothetical protein